MAEQEVYYFGDARLRPGGPGAGHHLWCPAPRGKQVSWPELKTERSLPWSLSELDAGLAGDPALEDRRRPGHWAVEDQPEGVVRLHHRDGWTAIAFWDRSADERGGANSVFIARGTFGAREMVARFQAAFPDIWARIAAKFELRLPLEPAQVDEPPRASTGLRVAGLRVRIAESAPAAVDLADLAEPEGEPVVTRRRAVVGGTKP